MVLEFVSLSPGLSGSRSPHGAWEVSDSEELPCEGTGLYRGGKAVHILEPLSLSAQQEQQR